MRRGLKFCAAMAIAAMMVACGESAAPLDGAVDGQVTLVPVGVDTVAPTSVRAGQTLMVSCLLVDASGETFAPPAGTEPALRFVPEASVERQGDGSWVAVRRGEVEVACTFHALNLTDDTPALVEILPGEPAWTTARVEPDSIRAGESFEASCEAFDAYGNLIEDAAPIPRADPADSANAFEGTTGTFTRAGRFDVVCELDGASGRAAPLEVLPALPASLLLARVPDQPFYALGQVIEIERLVADRFDNRITEARVPTLSAPAGEALGEARFRYSDDGRYTITATVSPPTEGDVALSATTELVVDGNGPAIGCDEPFDGAILNLSPGTTVTFRGAVNDLSGVSEVRVNGAPVPVEADGSFTTTLASQYGINFVDLAAVDGAGREASRTCAFLVASAWAPDTSTSSDTLSLRLRQAALDDGNRSDGLDSLADLLHTVLNSSGLRDTLHTSLRAANPLKPDACDQTIWPGICVLRSKVTYNNLQINGPNSTSLALVQNGLRATVGVRNLRINIRVEGHVSGIPYDTTGWVTFSSADVGVIFNTALSAGQPRVTVRPGSTSVSVGGISTSFSGIDGAIVNIVADLFEGTVRNMVRDLVRDWVTDNFDSILDGVLGGLDVASLGTAFQVPRLDGGAPIPMSFNVGFSSLNTSTSRMLFGLGTRFHAPPAHARTTRGAPLRGGGRLLDISGTAATAVAVHEAVLGQALHALWRGGFFDATLDSSALSGLPTGVEATIATGLPPVALLRADGRVELQLGALQVALTYPDLFTTDVQVGLGARVSLAVALSGEELRFSDVRVEALFFSTDLASLDMHTRDTIEGLLSSLLERLAQTALEGALPAIPIPSFTLPASLGIYGLPAGAELGLVSPSLSSESPHFVLRGAFAVR